MDDDFPCDNCITAAICVGIINTEEQYLLFLVHKCELLYNYVAKIHGEEYAKNLKEARNCVSTQVYGDYEDYK